MILQTFTYPDAGYTQAGTEVFTQPMHAWNFPINMEGKVFKQPTYKEYTRNVFKPGQEAQCRNAA
ncbi:hypothetical protein HaLaN_11494 [Haematococcus lacustris]|uniref:Uncharacterized protein n=1 Tax=Haematococcus lacustris TaxID=44745 RepID=A0A699YYB5_HAELA|nr:hypothetical protein HaLaN_11494 [Haematococcus lacustris]